MGILRLSTAKTTLDETFFSGPWIIPARTQCLLFWMSILPILIIFNFLVLDLMCHDLSLGLSVFDVSTYGGAMASGSVTIFAQTGLVTCIMSKRLSQLAPLSQFVRLLFYFALQFFRRRLRNTILQSCTKLATTNMDWEISLFLS
jgi:hypothetical protein